jgi:Transglycosylase SLT domain
MALGDVSQSLAPAPQSDYMDDTAIRRKRALAEALMQQGSDTSPIRSPWQGVARLVQGLMGGIHEASADRAEHENNAYNADLMKGLMQPAASSGVGGATAAPAMLTPSNGGGNPPLNGSVSPRADLLPAFAQAGTRWGVSPEYLSRTAQIESGMNPNAKNPSGAAGLMQFVPSTAKAYNLFNPFDAGASIDAAGHLAADNKKVLVASLGREPSAGELYLAHQQGAGNAAKLLANPNVPASSIVGQNAVVQNGGNPNMTAGQFAGMWLNKFGGAPAAQPEPQMADNSGGVTAAPAAQNGQAQRLLAAMADPRLSAQNKQVLMMMYQNARKQETGKNFSNVTLPDGRVVPFDERTGSYGTPLNVSSGYRPMTEQEKQAYGVPPNTAAFMGPDGKPHPLTNGGATVNIGAGETEEAKALGKLNADSIAEMRKAGDNAPVQMSKLNLVDRMLGSVQTGALADFKSDVARYGRALGLSDGTIASVADPNLPITQQVANKVVNEMVLGKIGSGGMPANNFSDADRRFLSDIFPKITNEPGANKIAIEVLRRVEQRNAEKLQAWDNYSEQAAQQGKHPSFEEFDRMFRRQVQGQDMFKDIQPPATQPQMQGTTKTNIPYKVRGVPET